MVTCWQRSRQRPHFVHKLHSISPAQRFCVYLYIWAASEISVTTINKGKGTSWKTGEFQMWEMFPRFTKHNSYPPTVSPPNVLRLLSTSEPWTVSCVIVVCVSSDSTVLILTKPQVGLGGNCSVYGTATKSSVLQNAQTGSGALPTTYSMGIDGCLSGGKTAGTWTWPLISM